MAELELIKRNLRTALNNNNKSEEMAEAIQSTPASLLSLFQPYHYAEVNTLQEYNTVLTNISSREEDDTYSYIEDLEIQQQTRCCTACAASSNPLLEAVNFDHLNCLKVILQHQPELDLFAPLLTIGVTITHVAARRGCLEVLQILLEHDPSLAMARDYKGATPLHISSRHGQLLCLRYLLLNTDTSANVKDSDGATPVHFAAISGSLDCLKELCMTGKGNVDCTTISGETPGMMYSVLYYNYHYLHYSLFRCTRRSFRLSPVAYTVR